MPPALLYKNSASFLSLSGYERKALIKEQKIGQTYFELCQTYFKISQTYFFSSPTNVNPA